MQVSRRVETQRDHGVEVPDCDQAAALKDSSSTAVRGVSEVSCHQGDVVPLTEQYLIAFLEQDATYQRKQKMADEAGGTGTGADNRLRSGPCLPVITDEEALGELEVSSGGSSASETHYPRKWVRAYVETIVHESCFIDVPSEAFLDDRELITKQVQGASSAELQEMALRFYSYFIDTFMEAYDLEEQVARMDDTAAKVEVELSAEQERVEMLTLQLELAQSDNEALAGDKAQLTRKLLEAKQELALISQRNSKLAVQLSDAQGSARELASCSSTPATFHTPSHARPSPPPLTLGAFANISSTAGAMTAEAQRKSISTSPPPPPPLSLDELCHGGSAGYDTNAVIAELRAECSKLREMITALKTELNVARREQGKSGNRDGGETSHTPTSTVQGRTALELARHIMLQPKVTGVPAEQSFKDLSTRVHRSFQCGVHCSSEDSENAVVLVGGDEGEGEDPLLRDVMEMDAAVAGRSSRWRRLYEDSMKRNTALKKEIAEMREARDAAVATFTEMRTRPQMLRGPSSSLVQLTERPSATNDTTHRSADTQGSLMQDKISKEANVIICRLQKEVEEQKEKARHHAAIESKLLGDISLMSRQLRARENINMASRAQRLIDITTAGGSGGGLGGTPPSSPFAVAPAPSLPTSTTASPTVETRRGGLDSSTRMRKEAIMAALEASKQRRSLQREAQPDVLSSIHLEVPVTAPRPTIEVNHLPLAAASSTSEEGVVVTNSPLQNGTHSSAVLESSNLSFSDHACGVQEVTPSLSLHTSGPCSFTVAHSSPISGRVGNAESHPELNAPLATGGPGGSHRGSQIRRAATPTRMRSGTNAGLSGSSFSVGPGGVTTSTCSPDAATADRGAADGGIGNSSSGDPAASNLSGTQRTPVSSSLTKLSLDEVVDHDFVTVTANPSTASQTSSLPAQLKSFFSRMSPGLYIPIKSTQLGNASSAGAVAPSDATTLATSGTGVGSAGGGNNAAAGGAGLGVQRSSETPLLRKRYTTYIGEHRRSSSEDHQQRHVSGTTGGELDLSRTVGSMEVTGHRRTSTPRRSLSRSAGNLLLTGGGRGGTTGPERSSTPTLPSRHPHHRSVVVPTGDGSGSKIRRSLSSSGVRKK